MPPTKELNEKEKTLYRLISEGSAGDIKTLLNDKDVQVDCLDDHGMTPLQHAAYRGDYELCKLFLDRGADVNSNYHDTGYSALMFAGLVGKLDVVSLLLEHGASTTAVNSVGRNASQMAAFVGNHEVVSIISNFVPLEDIEYYTRVQGLEKEPKLPPSLAHPLHKFALKTNIHPVSLAMHLQQNPVLLEEGKKVKKVLDLLSEKQMKQHDRNEMLGLKFHYLAFVLEHCYKVYVERKVGHDDNILEQLMKLWVKGRDSDGFPVNLEKFLRQSIREFPFHDSTVLQQLVATLSSVEIGQEPSAFSILAQIILGQKGISDVEVCSSCGEPNAEKRCSACKAVQYCNQYCQKLHWPTHKKQCPFLAAEAEKAAKEMAKEADADKTEIRSPSTGTGSSIEEQINAVKVEDVTPTFLDDEDGTLSKKTEQCV